MNTKSELKISTLYCVFGSTGDDEFWSVPCIVIIIPPQSAFSAKLRLIPVQFTFITQVPDSVSLFPKCTSKHIHVVLSTLNDSKDTVSLSVSKYDHWKSQSEWALRKVCKNWFH